MLSDTVEVLNNGNGMYETYRLILLRINAFTRLNQILFATTSFPSTHQKRAQ